MQPMIGFLRENARWLGTCTLLSFLSSFGQTFVIAVFAGEIRAEFGLSHTGWGAVYASATMASALAMVFAGGISDRVRVRILGPSVLVGLAGAALVMALAWGLWALVVAVFLLRFTGQGLLSHVAMTAVARWFVASRGRASSVAMLGFSLGEALLPLTMVMLMGFAGWRGVWLGIAAVACLMAPLIAVLMRHERRPQSFAGAGSALGRESRMWTRGEVLRDGLFWLMVPALLGPPMWNTAFMFHQVHLAEVKGWTHAGLVALFPAYTLAGVLGALGAGWLVDRLGSARLLPVYLLGMAAGYAVFALAAGPVAGGLALGLMGVTAGLHGMVMATLWAEAYGTRHIGAIRAMLGGIMVMGTALGPGLTGALIDAGVDYARQGWGVAVYCLAASGLAAAAARRMRVG